uniref:Uncharacterized protein n=1 Tax=Strongyloides venezuelensis TaxID=75913 RepID=A0A0K0FWU1_STRVS
MNTKSLLKGALKKIE